MSNHFHPRWVCFVLPPCFCVAAVIGSEKCYSILAELVGQFNYLLFARNDAARSCSQDKGKIILKNKHLVRCDSFTACKRSTTLLGVSQFPLCFLSHHFRIETMIHRSLPHSLWRHSRSNATHIIAIQFILPRAAFQWKTFSPPAELIYQLQKPPHTPKLWCKQLRTRWFWWFMEAYTLYAFRWSCTIKWVLPEG